jgi:hypothetical protein
LKTFLLSFILTIIHSIFDITVLIPPNAILELGYWAPVMLPLTIWKADGFMVRIHFFRYNKDLKWNAITVMASAIRAIDARIRFNNPTTM